MVVGSAGAACLMRQTISVTMTNAVVMPSDLCRLKKKARSGVFFAVPTMYQPVASKAMISSAAIQ